MRMILMNESVENMEFAFERDIITADDIPQCTGGAKSGFQHHAETKGLAGRIKPLALIPALITD